MGLSAGAYALGAGWALPDLCAHLERAPGAHGAQQDALVGHDAGDTHQGILRAVRLLAVNGEQDISGLQAGALGGAADIEIGDGDYGRLEAELLRLRSGS